MLITLAGWAAAMTCEEVQNMIDLRVPAPVILEVAREGRDFPELEASCPAVGALGKQPGKARSKPRKPQREVPRQPTFEPLPPWVRPGIEIVPA